MSFKMVDWASKLDFPNEPLLKFVLLALCNYANSDDEAWPSYPTIAKFCSISESTAMRHVKTLEERGYIIKTKRVHQNGRSKSNIYAFNMDVGVSPCQGEGVTVPGWRVSPCHPSKENQLKEPNISPKNSDRWKEYSKPFESKSKPGNADQKLNKLKTEEYAHLLRQRDAYLAFVKSKRTTWKEFPMKNASTFLNPVHWKEAEWLIDEKQTVSRDEDWIYR